MLNKNFKEGEYVYIPSGVVGYIFDDAGGVEKYIKFKEPKLLMFLGQEIDSYFGGEYLCKLFYEGTVYSIHQENVYSRGEL